MTNDDLTGLDDLIGHLTPMTKVSQDELSLALADPVDWLRTNKEQVQRVAKRPGFRFIMHRHPEIREKLEQTDVDAAVGFATGATPVDMSDEKKAIWHARMPKILAILKKVAQFTPIPYNFAVIGVIVILIIIDENRLTPKELAAMLAQP